MCIRDSYSIGWATGLRKEQPWLLWLLPVAGIAIVLLYKACKIDEDKGTNLVLLAVRANEKISARMAPLVFVATVLTHLCGGSSGREGAALQIGGSISSKIGRLFRFDEKDERIMTMCGMSAAFAALFGTPLTAAIFAMEVVSVGVMYYSAIVPCILSAVIGFAVAEFFWVEPERYQLAGIPQLDVLPVLQVIVLGVLCALLSMLFCKVTKGAVSYTHLPVISKVCHRFGIWPDGHVAIHRRSDVNTHICVARHGIDWHRKEAP